MRSASLRPSLYCCNTGTDPCTSQGSPGRHRFAKNPHVGSAPLSARCQTQHAAATGVQQQLDECHCSKGAGAAFCGSSPPPPVRPASPRLLLPLRVLFCAAWRLLLILDSACCRETNVSMHHTTSRLCSASAGAPRRSSSCRRWRCCIISSSSGGGGAADMDELVYGSSDEVPLAKLQQRLEAAIDDEDYAVAAQLRDVIQ